MHFRLRPSRTLIFAATLATSLAALPRDALADEPKKAADSADAPVLVMPKLVTFAEAHYPEAAQKDGLTASVVLAIEIDAAGVVTKVTVLEPAGHGFDEAATEAAGRFIFAPATKDGKPIASKISYRYNFTLTPVDPGTKEPVPPPTTGRLHGTVLLREGAAPLAGIAVKVTGPGGERVVTSNESGQWSLENLEPGRYHITVAPPGYEPLNSDEDVAVGNETDVKDRLTAAGDVAEVTVRGEAPPREVTKHSLSQRELSRIPGTNGDALRALQNLPGVGRSPGLRGLLIIRGSAPEDTTVQIDGIEVPIIYHFGGLSSVIPTEMIERLDFYPGNFGAQYGRAMGGIVDVATASSRGDGKFHGIAQADFIDARLLLQGPVPFINNWNFVIAGRRSYVDVWLKPILESRSGGVTAAPVYYDWQAFAETKPTKDSRIRIGFYGSDDSLDVIRNPVDGQAAASGSDLSLHTGFARVQGSYQADFGGGVNFRTTLAYGYDLQKFDSGDRQFDQVMHPIQNRSELSINLAPGYTLHLGDDIKYEFSNVNRTGPPPRRPGIPDTGQNSDSQSLTEVDKDHFFDPGFYSEIEMQLTSRLRVVPGFRADYASNSGHWDASPRISARFAVEQEFPKTTLKGGVGIYNQPPQLRETSAVFGTPGLYSNRSIHTALGVEQELTRQVDVSVEGFYKDLQNLVAPSPNTGSATTFDNFGSGYVVGAEVLLRYKPDERFFGWLAYTLSRSTRQEAPSEAQTLFQYDQTHILTVLGSYRIGGGWELGARFRYVSGDLYTPCNGGVQNGSTGRYVCVSAAPYSARLPAFEELDIRVDKHWYFESWQLSAYLDLINAYNRGNPEGISYNYNYTQSLYTNGLPIIPSFGIRGEF